MKPATVSKQTLIQRAMDIVEHFRTDASNLGDLSSSFVILNRNLESWVKSDFKVHDGDSGTVETSGLSKNDLSIVEGDCEITLLPVLLLIAYHRMRDRGDKSHYSPDALQFRHPHLARVIHMYLDPSYASFCPDNDRIHKVYYKRLGIEQVVERSFGDCSSFSVRDFLKSDEASKINSLFEHESKRLRELNDQKIIQTIGNINADCKSVSITQKQLNDMLDNFELLQRLLMQPDSNCIETKSKKEIIENMIHTILLSLDQKDSDLQKIFLCKYNLEGPQYFSSMRFSFMYKAFCSGLSVSQRICQRYSDPSSTTRTAFLSLFGGSSQSVKEWLDNSDNMDSIKKTLPSAK
ncbi:MAG: hypothetical protein CMF55_02695 [Legionellales bacterium]|nr:hypothetical protein [Legionellales bacterium]